MILLPMALVVAVGVPLFLYGLHLFGERRPVMGNLVSGLAFLMFVGTCGLVVWMQSTGQSSSGRTYLVSGKSDPVPGPGIRVGANLGELAREQEAREAARSGR